LFGKTFWWRGWFDNPARPLLLEGLDGGTVPHLLVLIEKVKPFNCLVEGLVFVFLSFELVWDALDCFHQFDDIQASFDLFEVVEGLQIGYHVIRALAEDLGVKLLTIHRQLGLASNIFIDPFLPDSFVGGRCCCAHIVGLDWHVLLLALDRPPHVSSVVISSACIGGDLLYVGVVPIGLFAVGAVKNKALDAVASSVKLRLLISFFCWNLM
jgi:hypothetical protein